MTATEFCYWLRGFIEIAEPQAMSERQLKIINDHLDLVLHKETPKRGGDEVPPWGAYRAVFPISTAGYRLQDGSSSIEAYGQNAQEVRDLLGKSSGVDSLTAPTGGTGPIFPYGNMPGCASHEQRVEPMRQMRNESPLSSGVFY